jgi:dienelactone hydrolase
MRSYPAMAVWISLMVSILPPATAQTSPESVKPLLERQIQPVAVTAMQVQQYLTTRIPKRSTPGTSSEWIQEAARLRKHMLNHVVFHGWPQEWVAAPPRFEEAGVVETQKGYRLRKLRYEIVPGFWSTAILYEPDHIAGKAPAILNVNGHEPAGKAAEYKQKRCINFAKRGIVALSLEWFGFGEMAQPENAHDFAAHLDLVGANGVGLFYLAMRKGLDYLENLPNVDRTRLGVTGLSGGGWQTIVLSSLDERASVMVEVAGFGSLESNITHPIDTDETEEDPADFSDGQDYPDLVALRAPRPTLLIHNAEDNCCFRAALVKPYIYEPIKPFFKLFGKEDALAWHENRDPGTHNYQLDNRQQAYQFFTQYLGLPVTQTEIPSNSEIKSLDELKVGLPNENLTVLGVARKLAGQIRRGAVPTESGDLASWASSQRNQLKTTLRYKPIEVSNAWRLWNTKDKGLETLFYRFDLSNHLSAAGLWLKAIAAPSKASATIILDDKGKKAAGDIVSDRVNRGEQVLALDLLFTGSIRPQEPDPTDYELLVNTIGDRPLGLEVAQLIAVANWLRQAPGVEQVRIETQGIRSQVIALAAAALEPALYSEVVTHGGISSLEYLLATPVPYRNAPDLFCLDLYKFFDLDHLVALARPTKVSQLECIKTTS